MPQIFPITPNFAVAGAVEPDELAAIAAAGFATVINNRPDGEEWGQAPAAVAAEEAKRQGLAYHHIPATRDNFLTDAVAKATLEAIGAAQGPVLAHCRSGLRSAVIWAAVEARSGRMTVAEILASARAAGFDLSPLARDLEALKARS